DGSSDGKSITITQATSSTTMGCPAGPYTYDGTGQTPCSVTVTGAGGLSLTPTPSYSGNTNAGTATASYTFTGDANHTGSSDSKTFTIGQASSTTVVSFEAGPYTYRGTAFTATAQVSGVGGLSAAVTPVVYTGDCTNVTSGGCTATATYGGDPNHNGSSDSKSITLTKASSATVVSCPTVAPIYTGSPIEPCTAAATGAGGLNVAVTPVTYTSNTNVGTAGASATYGGDANHFGSTGTGGFTIGKASSATLVSFEAGPYTYRGSAFTATAQVTGVGALSAAITPVVYTGDCTNVTSANGCTATATYAGDPNHNGSYAVGHLTVNPKALTVTANNKTKQYSDPLPAFDVWYSGLVPGPTVLGGTLS